MILDIGKHVEDTFKASMSCLENKDKDGAQVVLESDQIINRKEIEIEEECLKILALHQPVANSVCPSRDQVIASPNFAAGN